MFKKLVFVGLILMLATSTFAISDVGFGGGSLVIMEQGKHPSFGYVIKGSFPWGVNAKSIEENYTVVTTDANGHTERLVSADTTITFEVLTEAMTVYSNFKFEDYQELEGELLVTKVRKSLGFLSTYLEGGVTLWSLRATSKETSIKNGVADGYYLGCNIRPLNDIQVNLGGHIIPRTNYHSTFALQLDLLIIF